MIENDRIKILNNKNITAEKCYVLYWMQQSQRTEYNHALEFAIEQANKLHLPLLVCFGLMDDYPEANLRHYYFMIQGLKEVQESLKKRKIQFVLRKGNPADVCIALSKDAALVICDRGYLKHQKEWREKVAGNTTCKVIQVESDVTVPVETASSKAEYAARTIRNKVMIRLNDYIKKIPETEIKKSSLKIKTKSLIISSVDDFTGKLKVDRSVSKVNQYFNGGTSQAKKVFRSFLKHKLSNYTKNRNQPQTDDISHMSAYLHFGQISPIYLVYLISGENKYEEDVRAYIEELVVRRELSMNFVNFTPGYDSYSCIPEWARKSLKNHEADKRAALYSLEELEQARTNDKYWNACMEEMRYTGFMHNYMRMYWGKKIIEWTLTGEEAYHTILYLNNKYFLDGRDCTSYANAGWIFGLHDRAWFTQPVFGKVRIMKASGLERKFDTEAYIKKVEKLKKIAET